MLPEWPDGTVTILVTSGETTHAIPVSAAVRSGDRGVVIALAASRGSLARLRRNDAVALLIIAEQTAVTAHGRARVLDQELGDGVVAVLIEIEYVQDHNRPTFEILGGVSWRWTDPEAEARDEQVRAGLRAIAARLARE